MRSGPQGQLIRVPSIQLSRAPHFQLSRAPHFQLLRALRPCSPIRSIPFYRGHTYRIESSAD
jgi:hypothetical protein